MLYLERLRQIRQERGLSQNKIAEVLETTQQNYADYENGKHEIPTRHIITLCRFYDISADELLGLTEEISRNENA